MQKPDYNNSIMSITNSILRHYGALPHHTTLPILDGLLAKNYKNVIFLLMDGMGMNILERNLPESAFLRRNIKSEISSVFPPTTTAATASALTGKTPAEHGWLGWSCYFKEVDKCVDLFSNRESGTANPASEEHQAYSLLPYDNVLKTLGENVRTHAVWPFSNNPANTMDEVCSQLKDLCAEDGRKFIYAYHYQPDSAMHELGIGHERVKEMLKSFDKQLKELADSLSDTLFIITADHGMSDTATKSIEDFPQISEALIRRVCVEPRCCSLYVKDEHKKDFPEFFADALGDKFILLSHDEFLESGLLGDGVRHPKIDEFVGDFVAVATADIMLWNEGEYGDLNAGHAGLTKQELVIPLIIIES